MARSFGPPAVPQGRKKRGSDSIASSEALGRCRGGFGTKINILCDGKGQPLTAVLSPAQDHESKHLCRIVESAGLAGSHSGERIVPAKLAGDKGYRFDWIDRWLLDRKITPVIPSKINENRQARLVNFDGPSYRRRCIIEQLIGWLKECRRVGTRYEKLARNYLSMVKLSMIGRYLRVIAPWNSTV